MTLQPILQSIFVVVAAEDGARRPAAAGMTEVGAGRVPAVRSRGRAGRTGRGWYELGPIGKM
jgi:hypothetical protein